jgi:hypothetical protein
MGDRLLLRRSTVNYFSKPPPELSHRLGLDVAHLGDRQAEAFGHDPSGHRHGQRFGSPTRTVKVSTAIAKPK